MSNFDERSIITRIEELKKSKNWSNYKLAQEAGISYPTLNNALKHAHIPNILTLSKICDGLGISLSNFFSYCNNDTTNTYLYLWNLLDVETQKYILAYMKGAAHLPLANHENIQPIKENF